jgi:hypothetical protein
LYLFDYPGDSLIALCQRIHRDYAERRFADNHGLRFKEFRQAMLSPVEARAAERRQTSAEMRRSGHQPRVATVASASARVRRRTTKSGSRRGRCNNEMRTISARARSLSPQRAVVSAPLLDYERSLNPFPHGVAMPSGSLAASTASLRAASGGLQVYGAERAPAATRYRTNIVAPRAVARR